MSKKHKRVVETAVEVAAATLEDSAEIRVDTPTEVVADMALTEGAEIIAHESDIDDAVATVVTDEARTAAYAAQPAETSVEGAAAPSVEGEAVAGKTKKARVPRMTLLSNKASEMIVRSLGASPEAYFQLDKDASSDADSLTGRMNATLTAIDALDKKAREKAVNFFSSIASGKPPSVYTRQAIKALQDRGSMLLKDLVAVYETEYSYKSGTARRQASELFSVLPLVGIANREDTRGAPLCFNKSSVLIEKVVLSGAAR